MKEINAAIKRAGWKQMLQTRRLEELKARKARHDAMIASFLANRPTSLPENHPVWQAIKAEQLLDKMYRSWRDSMVKQAQATKKSMPAEKPIRSQSGFWYKDKPSIFD